MLGRTWEQRAEDLKHHFVFSLQPRGARDAPQAERHFQSRTSKSTGMCGHTAWAYMMISMLIRAQYKRLNRNELVGVAALPAHKDRVCSRHPGCLHPWDFQSLLGFKPQGIQQRYPQFHQVTHTSSPLDFISSPLPASSCKCCAGPRCCGSWERFWHRLLLLEGPSVDETGQVASLAGVRKRLQDAHLVRKHMLKISATLIKNNLII